MHNLSNGKKKTQKKIEIMTIMIMITKTMKTTKWIINKIIKKKKMKILKDY